MARTPVSALVVKSGTTYTVPAGKTFVFAAHAGLGQGQLQVDGQQLATFYRQPSDHGLKLEAKPLVATAGQVMSVSSTGDYALNSVRLTGFLYDN